ncbi:benzoylformate decarboxylase [Sphingomonas kaistensis]|uniref:Benzoylformate decarboxylase n=1 Tax=Sphingomonas kaistensis TaxID=298708 RepID=A0A7X5Y7L0_9SPHN|nr:benzoylformate decarboxylase [Sphingomonas kaistensis]NJC06659.1 benzoylformate decarboxylase [Sphingomonas kaistensis]
MSLDGLQIGRPAETFGTTVRGAVMELLQQLGLTTIFGNPGSTELPMFRDLPDCFRYVLGLQESVVVAMADGFAQASGGAALVNLHSSAGVGHAMGNLFTAFRNGTPLVITAGQQARSMLPYAPFLHAERATELPRPFVKWAVEPARAQDVPQAIAQAYQVAMQAPRGPTFVSIPIDDWEQPARPVAVTRVSTRAAPDPAALAEAAATIAKASRVAIVAGTGVAANGARDGLLALVERLGAAVWIAPMAARNPFPEDHPLFCGFLPASREAIVQRLADADCILVLGAPVFTYHVEGSGPFVPPGAALIQIGDDPAQAARVPQGQGIVADLALALPALADLVPVRSREAAPSRGQAAAPTASMLTDALLMARLAALRPAGIAIIEEAPSTRGPMHDHLPMLAGDEFHTCASGGLGHGLPAAIGVALARPGEPVLCLLGDGSAMYAIQGIWCAAHYAADVRFVIVNNGGYAALDQFGALFGLKAVGSKMPGLDFVALAEAQGVPGECVSDPSDLDRALTALFAGAGPRLLEVIVTREGGDPHADDHALEEHRGEAL